MENHLDNRSDEKIVEEDLILDLKSGNLVAFEQLIQENYLEHCLVESATGQGLAPESPMVVYLEECVGDLPDGQQELLKRRYKLLESTRDVSEALGQSEAWVRTTLCRVRRALRTCVEDKESRGQNAAVSI